MERSAGSKNARGALRAALALGVVAIGAAAFGFTRDEAANGKILYINNCAACHGMDLLGGAVPKQFGEDAGQQAPALAGPNALPGFFSAVQIYDYSRSQMPAQSDGSLTTLQYTEITAFLIMVNHLAAPTTLSLTVDEMRRIQIQHGP